MDPSIEILRRLHGHNQRRPTPTMRFAAPCALVVVLVVGCLMIANVLPSLLAVILATLSLLFAFSVWLWSTKKWLREQKQIVCHCPSMRLHWYRAYEAYEKSIIVMKAYDDKENQDIYWPEKSSLQIPIDVDSQIAVCHETAVSSRE